MGCFRYETDQARIYHLEREASLHRLETTRIHHGSRRPGSFSTVGTPSEAAVPVSPRPCLETIHTHRTSLRRELLRPAMR